MISPKSKAPSLLLAALLLLACSLVFAFIVNYVATPETPAMAEAAPESAPAVTELRTLIIHANALGTPASGTDITAMEGMVFNDSTNISDALFDATYGHFRLVAHEITNDAAGQPITPVTVKSITVNINTRDPWDYTADQMEVFIVDALPAAFTALNLAFNPADYDRYLICMPYETGTLAPGGYFDDAYGYYSASPTAPLRSVFGWDWTGTTFDGILFALGNNFGFGSSGLGADPFGDRTCAMGTSHFTYGNVTATYNAVKKDQAGWFAPFPGTKINLTEDATINLYPISQIPDTDPNTPDMRMVSIDGTNYRISYRRQEDPYAWLRYGSDADKVYIHTDNGLENVSYRESQLDTGGYSDVGTTRFTFEGYGPGNAYATVSFDLADGNTRPVANSRFIPMRGNRGLNITLTATDAEGDILNYAVASNPSNGVISGTAPNLIYTPTTNFLGQDSFTFKVDDGKISAFGTVTIDVTNPNIVPVADAQSIAAFYQTPEPIALSGSDGDSDPITFSVVSGPTNGVLSGFAPDLTYTPNNGYSGPDSFTFKANDGYDDSPAVTVSITVLSTSNNPPEVYAGADKAVNMLLVDWAPGLYYGTASGYANDTTPNPKTAIITDVGGYTEDGIPEYTTEIYTGRIYDADGVIRFYEHMDNRAVIKIDGIIVHSDDRWDVETTSPVINLPPNPSLPPGWHEFEIRISNILWGGGPLPGNIGIGYDPNGGTNWRTLVDPGDGSFLRCTLTSPATSDQAEVALADATVIDPEHTPSYLWTDTGTGTSTGTVTFSDPTALNPTAIFSKTGTYVLRLTADDGYSQDFDEVTITVSLPGNNPAVVNAGSDQTVVMVDTVPWTPDMLDPAAWYDATVSSTITAKNGSVSQWNDRSGNDHHMLQATTLMQPKTGTKSINGKNTIDFDGIQDGLLTAANPFGVTINDAMIISVVNIEDKDWTNVMFSLAGPGGDLWQATVPVLNNGLDFKVGESRLGYATNWSDNQNKLLAFYCSTSDNLQQMWANGSLLRSSGTGYAVNAGTGMALGFDGSGNSDNCYMGEVIILNRTVSAEDRQKLEGYLAHKWGMTADLPGGHPYKTAPPLSIRAVANLNTAVASDADSHSVTTAWSVDSGPGPVTFSDTGAVNPTATFREPGTYVLRLNAYDRYQFTPSSDTLTITVLAGGNYTLTVTANGGTGATGGGSHPAGLLVPIGAGTPTSPNRFLNWTSSAGGSFTNANAANTTFTMPFNDATVTANFGPNNLPAVNAGLDQNLAFKEPDATSLGWSFTAWTGDTDSGILSDYIYTALQSFGTLSGGSVTVNGVTFPENFDSSGTGWAVGGGKTNYTGDDNAVLTGESEKLGKSFISNGKPRTVTFSGLTVGRTYQANFYSVAWETGDRSQTFSVSGLTPVVINQDHYGNNNGIRITCTYVATGTSQTLTIAPTTGNTFHLYAFSNREASTTGGAFAILEGSAADPDGDSLTTAWSVVSKNPGTAADPTFDNASLLNTTVRFTALGTYTLQLTANDGYGSNVIDQIVITVGTPAPYPLTVTNGTGDGTPVSGTKVVITAVAPAPGLRFVNWTTSSGGIIADANASTTTYTMPGNAAEVTANFEPNTLPVVDAGADQSGPFIGLDGPTQAFLSASDTIQGFRDASVGNNSTDGSSYSSNESPQKAIDGSADTKYLNLGKVGSGFYVTPGIGHTKLTGVKIVTANDRSGRDPLTISIEGSNGGDLSKGTSWSLIQDNINLGIGADPGRKVAGPLVAVSASSEYRHYRVIIKSLRNPSESSTQYAEIQLHGYTPAATLFTLRGSATDSNLDPLTTTWSVQAAGGAATPSIASPSQLETTVRITEPGTFTFRLTANDGIGTAFDDVDITVNPIVRYNLTVTDGTGDGQYIVAEQIPITAVAPVIPAEAIFTSYRFINWTTSDGGSFGNANSPSTTYTMPGNTATIVANFQANTPPAVDAGAPQTVSILDSVPWTPAWTSDALNTKAWYDATDAASFAQSVGSVSQWNDKSGNGKHLYATTANDEPYRGTQTINGLNTVYFDGGSDGVPDSLRQVGNVFGPTLSEATVFVVWELEEIVDDTILQLDPANFTIGIRYGRSYVTEVKNSINWDGWMEWYNPGLAGSEFIPMMINPRYSVSENSYRNYVNGSIYTNKKANGLVATTDGMKLLNFKGKCGEMIVLNEAVDDTLQQKFEGYLAHKWGLEANLPALHPYKASPPVATGVSVTLAGSATDLTDGDPLTINWEKVSGPGTVGFSNANALNSIASFTVAGTYVLRLTVSDGYDTVIDTVTITVDPPSTPYGAWAGATFANAFTDTALTSNPDGDLMTNMMEFAFGTDPTVQDGGPMTANGSVHGAPILKDAGGGNFEFYFIRRKDHGTPGSCNYTPQFSSNLQIFTDNDNNANPLIKVGDSLIDAANYEVMKVPYPAGTRFGRIKLSEAP